MTVKKHRQAQHRAASAATLPLLLLIITSLTVPLMLFSAPSAAARTAAEDCEASGGTWVQRGDNGFCFRTLEPIVCTLPPIPEVPDPPLECRGGVIVAPDIDEEEDFSAEILDFAFDVADVDRDGTEDGNGGGDGNQDDANVQQQDSTQDRTQGDNNVNENTQVDVQRQSEQIVTDDGGGTDGGSARD